MTKDLQRLTVPPGDPDSPLMALYWAQNAQRWGQVILYAAIHEAHLAGISNRAIARQSRLTHTGVQRILDRWPTQAAELGLVLAEGRWCFRQGQLAVVDAAVRGGTTKPPAGN